MSTEKEMGKIYFDDEVNENVRVPNSFGVVDLTGILNEHSVFMMYFNNTFQSVRNNEMSWDSKIVNVMIRNNFLFEIMERAFSPVVESGHFYSWYQKMVNLNLLSRFKSKNLSTTENANFKTSMLSKNLVDANLLNEAGKIPFQRFAGIFYMFLVMCGIAIVVFLGEIVVNYVKKVFGPRTAVVAFKPESESEDEEWIELK
jgi:hypothetical protein